ncbi:AIR synthase family protein [Ihubacter massiliensis]|uniref:AIR synthase family protein n=1 Tax=Hominibacterium faecale TaxID=2839743 RepID=A0A9J6QVK7_9FIRM|nr:MULTISPECIES: AIR synthase family protein [Eubacteriales Family XIII. Incertae Sedis]MCO7122518.1 AIR synthase family protein [Ihubacter massiliensis]MCU7376794.1 AIR synthase family protein [Hominibacterium faecale]MCU7379343.1 AIR synthase family protein [Hominibacterium faecale]
MLKTGKLDSELLEKIVFNNIKFKRPEVLTRPGIGEDCAVVDFGSYECIMSTDPITAAISEIGRLSIHISCNDIASNGIQPLGIMLAVMLPVGTTEEQIEEMMRQAGEASEELGVEIIGGHTEITPAVTKPVIVSTAIGRGEKWASQHSENMRPGDLIMITKSAGLEGSGIIACDFEEQLQKVLTHEEIEKAKSLLGKVSVVKEGVAAGKVGTHGMHDVTEGGVLGAVWEMCQIAGTGAELWVDQVPVEPVTRKICDYFDIDYLRLISSGCMIIMVAPDKKEEMAEAMKAAGVEASYIGVIKDSSAGICMNVNGELIEIAPPASDELYKVVGEES